MALATVPKYRTLTKNLHEMAGEAAAALLAVQAAQLLLATFETNFHFGAFQCPLDASMDTITSTSFNYIVVGAGSAGSVLARRLSECSNKNVLLLEAGGCPPIEAYCMGYFTLQPQSAYDYNMTAVNDGYSCQNLQGGSVGLTTGKMLGGSSSLHHGIWIRGNTYDFDSIVNTTGDSSWSYKNMVHYFVKSESVTDRGVLKNCGSYCGTHGPIQLKRQLNSKNDGILDALKEQGYNIVNNSNANVFTNIALEPLLSIGKDGSRQSGLSSYITPIITRSNLYVLTGATVSKINFDDDNVATGVTFTYSGTSFTVNATSEVILAAGALITPQLLMLSGIGPSDHLTEKGITVLSDLPVGDHLLDHPGVNMVISLEEDTSTTPGANPLEFPGPVTCNYINLSNKSSTYPEYQSINLVFPHDYSGFLQLCANAFKYSNDICDALYTSNTGKNALWMVLNKLSPNSFGKVRLNTTDINDPPVVNLGLFSNNTDLVDMAKFLNHTAQLVNTTYFKSVGAELNDLGLCSNYTRYSTEYWQCYALAMSSTMWHYSGTTSLESVVDTNGVVYGVSNLRVVDASIFSKIPSGNINAAVVAAAEKIADVIVSALDTCTNE